MPIEVSPYVPRTPITIEVPPAPANLWQHLHGVTLQQAMKIAKVKSQEELGRQVFKRPHYFVSYVTGAKGDDEGELRFSPSAANKVWEYLFECCKRAPIPQEAAAILKDYVYGKCQ